MMKAVIRVRIKITEVVSKSRIKILKITTTQKHDNLIKSIIYFVHSSFILAEDSNAESSVRTIFEGRESKLSIAFRLAHDFYMPMRKIIQSKKF